jgi:hypothetical protein
MLQPTRAPPSGNRLGSCSYPPRERFYEKGCQENSSPRPVVSHLDSEPFRFAAYTSPQSSGNQSGINDTTHGFSVLVLNEIASSRSCGNCGNVGNSEWNGVEWRVFHISTVSTAFPLRRPLWSPDFLLSHWTATTSARIPNLSQADQPGHCC